MLGEGTLGIPSNQIPSTHPFNSFEFHLPCQTVQFDFQLLECSTFNPIGKCTTGSVEKCHAEKHLPVATGNFFKGPKSCLRGPSHDSPSLNANYKKGPARILHRNGPQMAGNHPVVICDQQSPGMMTSSFRQLHLPDTARSTSDVNPARFECTEWKMLIGVLRCFGCCDISAIRDLSRDPMFLLMVCKVGDGSLVHTFSRSDFANVMGWTERKLCGLNGHHSLYDASWQRKCTWYCIYYYFLYIYTYIVFSWRWNEVARLWAFSSRIWKKAASGIRCFKLHGCQKRFESTGVEQLAAGTRGCSKFIRILHILYIQDERTCKLNSYQKKKIRQPFH